MRPDSSPRRCAWRENTEPSAVLKEEHTQEGVVGVLHVTYSSLTTTPRDRCLAAKHGILANTTFDPLQQNQGGWYWLYGRHSGAYAVGHCCGGGADDREPSMAGHRCAHITWNIPEISLGARARRTMPTLCRLFRPADCLEEAKDGAWRISRRIDTVGASG